MAVRVSKALERQLRANGVLPPKKPASRGMNRTEAAYAEHLRVFGTEGQPVIAWAWEVIKLRLADKTWYTPDFFVLLENGELQFHECKGWMRDDAAVKIKVAAELYPWRFVIVRKTKGGWEFEDVPGKRP